MAIAPLPLDVTAGASAPIAPVSGRQAALIFIFITVTIDTVAMGVTAPVLPKLILHLTGGVQEAGWMNGLFMTVFALMQFLFSPVLGALSDRYGRRPILLLSIFGMGMSYVGMALATSIWQLLLVRLLTGATSANLATAFAYVADTTPSDKRAGAFGMLQAAMSLGFATGPAIGGMLGHFDPRAPFWAAAAISLLNAAFGFFVVPESLARDRRAPLHLKSLGSFGAMKVLTAKAGLFKLAMILVLAQFATMVFPTVFVLYAASRYRWGDIAVALCLTAFGTCSAAVQMGLSGRAVRMFGERKVILFAILCGVVGTAVFGLAPLGVLFLVGVPIMTLSGMSGPALQSLMTRQVSPSEQGRLQGANTSLQAVAGIVAPMLFGGVWILVAAPNLPQVFLGAPFLLASLILLGSAVLASRSVGERHARF